MVVAHSFGLRVPVTPGLSAIVIPDWFLILLLAFAGALPWLRLAFQPPHAANRHDAGCRGAGVRGLRGQRIIHADASDGQRVE